MNNPAPSSSNAARSASAPSASFWERIINDQDLRGRTDLEKLLAGCEIIAALDKVELLAA
jgi:hypothetical protein